MRDEKERLMAIHKKVTSDPFARFLGATLEDLQLGYARMTLMVTAEMQNFHGMTHGGLVFALGDMAFAAASNSHGQTAVALNVDISFMRPTKAGDCLIAEAQEQDVNGPVGLYDITVREAQSGELIAQSQAMVYRKREFFVE